MAETSCGKRDRGSQEDPPLSLLQVLVAVGLPGQRCWGARGAVGAQVLQLVVALLQAKAAKPLEEAVRSFLHFVWFVLLLRYARWRLKLLCAPALRERTLQSAVANLAGRRCQDSDAEAGGSRAPGLVVGGCWQDWLAKSREEVEGFGKDQVSRLTEAVLSEGKVRDELIQQTVTTLQQQGVTGKSLLKLTLEKLIQVHILWGLQSFWPRRSGCCRSPRHG